MRKFLDDEGFATHEESIVLPSSEWKRNLWELFEQPQSSRYANVVAVINLVVIATSIFTFVLETLPQFKQYRIVAARPLYHELLRSNGTADREFALQNLVTRTITEDDVPRFTEPFFITETLCIFWFITELLLRYARCCT